MYFQYIAHTGSINLRACSVSLVNYSKEVLKVSATQFITHLQHRPDSGGLKYECYNILLIYIYIKFPLVKP